MVRRVERGEAVRFPRPALRSEQIRERGGRLDHLVVLRAEGTHADVERATIVCFGLRQLAFVAQQAGQAVERDGEPGIVGRQPLLLDGNRATEK